MSEIGKSVRLRNILNEDGRTLIVALDHGLSVPTVRGLEEPLDIMRKVKDGGADAIITTIGTVRRFYRELPRGIGLIMSIPPEPSSIRTAANLGMHAVKNTFFGPLKGEGLGGIHALSLECEFYGMPLLAEIVPMDPKTGDFFYEPSQIKEAVRIAAEFGADLVKTNYTGSPKTFREVVDFCQIPIVILGGAMMDDDESVLENAKGAIDAGAAGVAFGRNIFQHRNPTAMTRAIASIIHGNAGVGEAMGELR